MAPYQVPPLMTKCLAVTELNSGNEMSNVKHGLSNEKHVLTAYMRVLTNCASMGARMYSVAEAMWLLCLWSCRKTPDFNWYSTLPGPE